MKQLGDDVEPSLYIKNRNDIEMACTKKGISYPPKYYRISMSETGNIIVDVYSDDEVRRTNEITK